jgi:hypothetical protein
MQGLFFETDTGVRYFLRALVMVLGFWTAWRAGRAVAEGWNGYGYVIAYTLLLAVAMQFMHYALFQGPFISAFHYIIDVVLLMGFSISGFRIRRTRQMVQNYYWLYQPVSAFSWKKKD